MNSNHPANEEQATIWNGASGHAWVKTQALLDQLFKPIENALLAAIPDTAVTNVLDIGCGTGGLTLAVASRPGTQGRCVGIDISEPMLTAARQRAERDSISADFVLADAQEYDFGQDHFDLFVSRFGVMFFDDPVRAFTNLRSVATGNAALRFVAWRGPADNPFMTTIERAASPLLPNIPVRQPNVPGPFGFADDQRVYGILNESGWAGIDIQPLDISCILPEKDLELYFTRIGPLGRALQQVDEETRRHIIQTVRAAFDPFVDGEKVHFPAACWLISAQASTT